LNYERSISAANDGSKWRFDVIGAEQPFEETDCYSARKIQDRFTPEMLDRYCRALAVRVFDERFYDGPGLLAVIHDPLPSGAQPISLVEAQKRLLHR
jgi:hypothetical protein